MSDLSTKYLGFTLKSPLWLPRRRSPSRSKYPGTRRSKLGAVVLPSLFEEQLELESLTLDSDLDRGSESFPESANFLPDLQTYNLGPDGYLNLISDAKEACVFPLLPA